MNWSYRLGWIFFRALFATYLPCRYRNHQHVPASGPVILAANHASFFDPPVIGAGLPRMVNYLARDTLFDIPIFASVLRSWKVVPVDRESGGAGLKAIFDRLLHGGMILLFPEGTRTADGTLGSAKPGVGLIIAKSTAPVVPVRVFGTFRAYGRHLTFPRPGRLSVVYGPPLDFAALRTQARTCPKPRAKEVYQQIAEQLMAAIARLEP